jgi:hypothetical protein
MRILSKVFLATWLVIIGLLVFCGAHTSLVFVCHELPQFHAFSAGYGFLVGCVPFYLAAFAVLMHFHPGYRLTWVNPRGGNGCQEPGKTAP